ncbi:MAG: hypothetical protein MUP28_02280 [Candidatus Aminicenantes bacterium]|nr:hypothetical protein [Candidatus Aminicenantes bacterium]
MTNGAGLRADFSGAICKTQVLKALPKAHKYQATTWTAETIKALMDSAGDRQLSVRLYHSQKTSMMMRNIGKVITVGDDRWTIAIGTGVGGKQSVPYAKIQDEGGTTHPTVTKRMRGWAWFMYAKWKEERFKWLALTKKSKLNVVIPASKWFTSVIEKQEPILEGMMQPAAVLKVAEIMGGGGVGLRSEIK